MAVEPALRRTHRAIATIFLASMIPAGIVSVQGNAAHPLVYAPLPFLFVLILTGTYLLVRPWVERLRARPTPIAPGEAEANA